MNKPIHPNFFIPETFGDAVSYEVQVKYLHQRLKDLEEEGIPTPDLTGLKQRVTTLETEVSAIQGEIEDLDLESITAQFEQINADIEQLQATQSQQGTTLQGYNTRLLDLETTTDAQDQAIDALDGRVTGVTTAVSNVVAEQTQMAQDIAGKQDQLTAGANITIQNNVISASGGGGGTIDIDTTVTANSQHAVTSEGIYNAIQTAKTAVETQHTTDINRIDGELAGKASAASVTTLRGDMEDEIERVEGDYQDADTALDTRLTAVETAQTTTEGNVTTLQQNVTTLQQTQTSQGTAIHGIRGRLDTAESNITQLQTDTSTLSGDVSSLQQTVSGKQDQLTAGTNITIQNNVISASGGGGSVTLDNDVTQNSQNGVKSSGIYTAIQNAKSDMATQDAAIQADLTALTTRVDDVEDDVEQAQTDISTLQTGQQTLTTNLSTETSARETADQALRIDVNANASAINTLRTNTNASITQLQTDVAGKQDQLTAGSNITIENNVISSSGGGGSVIAGMTISELSQAISYSSRNSAIKAPDVVKQHGGNGKQKVLLPSDAFTSMSGSPLITLPVYDSGNKFKAWPVDMYFEQPNVLTFKDYDNVAVEPTRFYNGSTNYSDVDTFSSFAANPFFCPNTRAYIGNMDSEDLSGSDDNDLICYEIPISWRLANINTDNYTANYTYNCINMNKRIMKGYAVYTLNNSGSYPVHCVGVMLVEPLYDTLQIIDKHDLIVMNMKCTRWIKYWGATQQDNPVAIVPIY